MGQNHTSAIVAALLLLFAAAVPAAVSAEPTLTLDVEQTPNGEATVTVTTNESAVENATVNVSTIDANAIYDGVGEYETDANGTVTLSAPEEDVTVEVTATDTNRSTTTTVDLEAPTLDVAVEQAADGVATVTVTHAITSGPADGAAVNVSSVDENATYDGVGEYDADENGTATLPAPEEDVTVEITAECECATGSTTADLEAPALDVDVEQADDGSATATVTYSITDGTVEGASVNVSTVDENATYDGEYETDENGSISLPAPSENVTIGLVASSDGLEGDTTADLVAVADDGDDDEEADSFGARVSAFVHSLLGDRDGGIGHFVAEFAVSNNPGNAPDHAGPPDDGESGAPDFVENRSDSDRNVSDSASADGSENTGGPPDHANNGGGDEGDEDRERRGNADGHDRDDHPGQGNARGR